MEENRVKEARYGTYLAATHRLGRILTVIVLVLLLAAPFVIGLYLNAMPNISACIKAFVGVGLVYLVSGIVEYLIYVPMLGAGGSYLAFITGNLINMKIPCAINARDIVGVKSGTPENEIISTLSIATSSLVTILVLALGVLLMIPLQPVLQSPALQPAFENVVPALFGAMACKYYRSDRTVALIVLTVMTLLFVFVPSLIGSTSMMVIPSGALAIVLTVMTLLFVFVPSLIGSTSMMVIPSGALAIVLSYLSFAKTRGREAAANKEATVKVEDIAGREAAAKTDDTASAADAEGGKNR